MQCDHIVDVNECLRTRTTVAVMLGEVKNGGITGNLNVARSCGGESMLPIDAEAKPINVKRLGELMIKYPENWYRRF